MFFFGHNFCKGGHSADVTPTSLSSLKRVRVQSCVIDTLYLTRDSSDKTGQSIPPVADWNFDTVFNAPFEENLLGGNVNFTADQIRCIRVKRAEAGSYRWLTLFEIPIQANGDLSFTRVDRTARGSQDYKYALVPVWNDNIEGNYNVNTVRSDFEGVWIAQKDMAVNALLNLDVSTTRNIVASTLTPLGRKYPYVNQYGDTNYTSGEMDVTFINTREHETAGGWDLNGAVKYREQVEQFLTNGCPKIIKHFDGRIWLACISGSVPKNESTHSEMPVQTVSFTEIGGSDSSGDLYHANLIDVNIEGGDRHGILSYAV